MIKTGKLYGVGVGPGDPDLLTLKAVAVLKSVDRVYDVIGPNTGKSVSGSILDSLDLKTPRQSLVFSMSLDPKERLRSVRENAGIVTRELCEGHSCAFATIGDPNIYSTFIYLEREIRAALPELEVEIVPGITSFQAAAAKAKTPLVEDTQKLLLTPAYDEKILDEKYSADTLVFLKTYNTKSTILDHVKAKAPDAEFVYAARVGIDGEKLTCDESEIREFPDEYLSLMIAKKSKK